MLVLDSLDRQELEMLLRRYGLELLPIEAHGVIPGSYWGEREAGLIGSTLFARPDTPVHSILHESAHFICMCPQRRAVLHTNAGGNDDEENAVCYLQLLLAAKLDRVGQERLCRDMDEWGYSFRLGSTALWFAQDAADAREWLLRRGLVDAAGQLTYARG